MTILSKIIKIFFITLGVIFLLTIIGGIYFWVADPFGIKAVAPEGISPIKAWQTITGNAEVKIDDVDKNPLLTEEQEAQLESLGIEPEKLPSEITPAMEDCFVQKLGQDRVNQILQGDAPTPTDFLKANSCAK